MFAATLAAAFAAALLPGFHTVATGPAGGVVVSGRIPNHAAPWDRRDSAIYLPPSFDSAKRYPVVYLLHGLPGRPSQYYRWFKLADVADALIAQRRVAPFIGVMPVAGTPGREAKDEWAGIWEDYVVRDVVPWTDAHLPTIATRAGRVISGVCAGGYGAVDIGLRHLDLFGTLESAGGYFRPFRDGPFARAPQQYTEARTPEDLVRADATRLRERRVRILLSTAGDHGLVHRAMTTRFAAELASLGIPHRLELYPASMGGGFWAAQLPGALRFAFGGV